MKLICVDNKVGWNEHNITIGKYYEAIYEKFSGVGIYNDIGIYEWYRRDRFITIKEYRKIKLEKIYESR